MKLFCKSANQNKAISGSQLLQNTWIIKQIVVLLWKSWRKYSSVSSSFSCFKNGIYQKCSSKMVFLDKIKIQKDSNDFFIENWIWNSDPCTFWWPIWTLFREIQIQWFFRSDFLGKIYSQLTLVKKSTTAMHWGHSNLQQPTCAKKSNNLISLRERVVA